MTTEVPTGATASPPHPTHRRLLHNRQSTSARLADVDAVIVPAGRPVEQLKSAVWLARNLNAPLIALCSLEASAAGVRARWEHDASIMAVDVRGRIRLPRLRTSTRIGRTPFARKVDTAIKRNVGLALTRMMGWERVLLLDDDIEHVQPEHTRRAAAVLDEFEVVGLENAGFKDNSVVCHANRDTGAFQSTFIGAGAMLIRGARCRSLFPDIYNEDWFFVLDRDTISPCAVAGEFSQRKFDPYQNPGRAASEEFGDCMAEGIFALLDAGRKISDANHRFWAEFLSSRRKLIDSILARPGVPGMAQFRRWQIDASLRAAQSSLELITPELCTGYLDAWRHDCDRWSDWINGLPQGVEFGAALAHLGIR